MNNFVAGVYRDEDGNSLVVLDSSASREGVERYGFVTYRIGADGKINRSSVLPDRLAALQGRQNLLSPNFAKADELNRFVAAGLKERIARDFSIGVQDVGISLDDSFGQKEVERVHNELEAFRASQMKEPQLVVSTSPQAEQDAARIRAGVQAERDAEEAIVRKMERESVVPQEKEQPQKEKAVSGPDVATSSIESAWQEGLRVNGEPVVGAYSNDGTGNPLVVYGKGEQTPEGKRYNGVRLFGNGMGQLVSIGSRFLSSIAMYQVTDETKILELVRRAGPVVKKLLNGLAKPVPFGDVASKAMNKAASAAINAGSSAVKALSKSDLAKTLKNSPLGRASAAVAAGMATARSVMAEGRAAAPSRTSPLTGVSKNAMADIAREAKRVKFALYDVNGTMLAVTNRRSRDKYVAVWLGKDGKYSRTAIDDKNLVRLNESFRSLTCSMDDKAKMSEVKKSNFKLLSEHKAKGLAAALGLSNNVAFVPDYGFVDGLAGKNFNPLSAQATLVLNAAKKNELPMFRTDGQVLSSGGDFYMFPQGLFLDGQRVSRLGGMQALALSAQCNTKGIKGNNNAVVLTSDAAKMGANRLDMATMANGPSVTSSSKANLYKVGDLALEEPSRIVSAQLAKRVKRFEESKGEFERTKKISHFIPVTSEMPLMSFMACSLAAGRLGCALKIDPSLLDKYREEFTSTFGAKLGSRDFPSLYKEFGSNLSKETDRIVSQKTHEWNQAQNPAVQKNVEFKRERSMSQGMSMGIG